MIRAVFFDFYSVWTPDKLDLIQARAEMAGPQIAKDVSDLIESYYRGAVNVDFLVSSLKSKLLDASIKIEDYTLNETSISPQIVNFMRGLHEHFLKVGILANLGQQELELLKSFDEHNQLFETIASPLSLGLDAPLLSQTVFSKALQAIGEPPTSTLYVSGHPAYLQFAANFGIQTLQFAGLASLTESMNKLMQS